MKQTKRTYIPDHWGRLGQGTWTNQKPRSPISRLPGPGEEDDFDLSNPFKLDRAVGRSGDNERPDVAKVEDLLGKSGYLDTARTDGPTGYFGTRVEQAAKKFQKDHGLRQDGLINPNGPTIGKLKENLHRPPSIVAQPKPSPKSTNLLDFNPEARQQNKEIGDLMGRRPKPDKKDKTQVALGPAAGPAAIAALEALGLFGAGVYGKQQIDKMLKNKQNRTVPMENPPKGPPPLEPSGVKEQDRSKPPLDGVPIEPLGPFGIPPSEPAKPEPDLKGRPDQSGEFDDLNIQEAKDFDKPYDFDKGDPLPDVTEAGLKNADPETAKAVRKVVLSSGKAVAGEREHTELRNVGGKKAAEKMFGDLAKEMGVQTEIGKDGTPFFKLQDKTTVSVRDFSKQGFPTLQINLPSVNNKDGHVLKIRFREKWE